MPTKATIEKAAQEWIILKAEKIALEKRFDELRELLEEHLKSQDEKTDEICGWKFTLIEMERESFSLAKAREKIDGRILKPYITHSKYSQIRTTWKGAKESEKDAA